MQPAVPRAATGQSAPTAQNRSTFLVAEKDSQIRAEKLVGMKVVNGTGEELGTVDDIVLNENGTVSGLVLKTGGVLGVGGKTVAIAWQDVAGAIHSDAVNVQMTKDQLAKAPAFKTKEDQSGKNSLLPTLPSTK
jgi:sporulation protein YlmC with PRC-barrel domain